MLLKKELKGHERILKNGTKVITHSFSERKKVVEQIESGELTIDEAMEKYNIAKRPTLYKWIREHSKHKQKYQVKTRPTPQQRIEAVTSYEQGRKDKYEIFREYNITEKTLKTWLNDYSCLPKQNKLTKEMNQSPSNIPGSKDYERALEEAKLKIIGLETMINIAEKEFNIPIRKKCGTKQ